MRLMVYLKLSAVKGEPSLNFTPFLSWNFHFRGPSWVHFVASQGFFSPVPVSA